MRFRRKTALTLSALVLATPVLTACGFNYATDRPYTPGRGVNDRAGTVDVLNALIVSGQDNSGTFIASLSNNDQEQQASFVSLAGAEGTTIQPGSFPPVPVDPGALVNLAIEGGVPVSGSFTAGEFVPVTLGFANGERVTLKVPVVPDEGDYEGLDTSAETSGDTETTTE